MRTTHAIRPQKTHPHGPRRPGVFQKPRCAENLAPCVYSETRASCPPVQSLLLYSTYSETYHYAYFSSNSYLRTIYNIFNSKFATTSPRTSSNRRCTRAVSGISSNDDGDDDVSASRLRRCWVPSHQPRKSVSQEVLAFPQRRRTRCYESSKPRLRCREHGRSRANSRRTEISRLLVRFAKLSLDGQIWSLALKRECPMNSNDDDDCGAIVRHAFLACDVVDFPRRGQTSES